jgi:hypothetical protein
LSHTRLPLHRVGDVAVDHSSGPSVGEEDFCPVQHALTCPHSLHDPKEEGSGDSVVGFAEVQENCCGGGVIVGRGSEVGGSL